MTTKRQHLVANVQRVFQILADHPDGLSSKDLREQLAVHHSTNGGDHKSNGDSPSFEELSFFCIGPIKAGWLVVERNHWVLSTEGKRAFENYSDPKRLVTESGKRSTQGWLAVHLPRAYSAAGKTKDQVTSEVRTLRRLGVSRLLKENRSPGRRSCRFKPLEQSTCRACE
jgi:hypothetical protein